MSQKNLPCPPTLNFSMPEKHGGRGSEHLRKKEPSLTLLWRKSVGKGPPPSFTEQPVLSRGCAHYPGTQGLLQFVSRLARSGFSGIWQLPKVAQRSVESGPVHSILGLLSPNLRVQASLSSPIPRHHQV